MIIYNGITPARRPRAATPAADGDDIYTATRTRPTTYCWSITWSRPRCRTGPAAARTQPPRPQARRPWPPGDLDSGTWWWSFTPGWLGKSVHTYVCTRMYYLVYTCTCKGDITGNHHWQTRATGRLGTWIIDHHDVSIWNLANLLYRIQAPGPDIGIWRYQHHEPSISKLRVRCSESSCASISGPVRWYWSSMIMILKNILFRWYLVIQ